MTTEQMIEELRAEIARMEQQKVNFIAEANRQIGTFDGAIASHQAMIERLSKRTDPAPAEIS